MLDILNLQALDSRLENLLNKQINSVAELEEWIIEEDQTNKEIDEQMYRFYIDFNCFNNDPEKVQRYEFSQQNVQPILKRYRAMLDKKFYENPYTKELDEDLYKNYIQRRLNEIELFREENIPLEVEEDLLLNRYNTIMGEMTVNWEGEEKTLQQISVYLMDKNRHIREKAWKLIHGRRMEANGELDEIMNKLLRIRHKIANNAGFSNYRDYMFKKYERFNYTPQDCKAFHSSVEKKVVPLKDKLEEEHKEKLGIDVYMPWDTEGTPADEIQLSLIENSEVLVEGTLKVLKEVKGEYADLLEEMKKKDMLDLDSRKAKSPGGFCSYLPLTKLPFIFMNFNGTYDGLSTMVHEMGHGVHDIMKSLQPLYKYQDTPMESAELASMAMELLTINHWNYLYPDSKEFKKVRVDHLEGIIKFLPWAMTVDKFQHWMYENPQHTADERNKKFKEIAKSLSHHYADWSQFETELENRWKAQLHIYEVPFYYIEYAIAQLGALQIWKNYCSNPKKTIEEYEKALLLGSSKSLPEVYETAGIKFSFTEDIIGELMDFLYKQLEAIKNQ